MGSRCCRYVFVYPIIVARQRLCKNPASCFIMGHQELELTRSNGYNILKNTFIHTNLLLLLMYRKRPVKQYLIMGRLVYYARILFVLRVLPFGI
jgi:hypothetical protein